MELMEIVTSADRDATLRKAAEGPPVKRGAYLDGTPIYVVTGYDEIMAALKDPRLGSDPAKQSKINLGKAAGIPEDLLPYFMHALGAQDPPDHTRLRRLVSKEFTFRRVERLRPRIQEIADELLDGLADQTDLVESFAYPLPVRVICELLGVPIEDQERWRKWSRLMGDPQKMPEAARGLVGYLLELIEAKRERPGDDLISALVRNDELTIQEIASLSLSILVAGHETTVTLIAGGALLLLTRPDLLARLRAEPDLIPGAVEEFLRHSGPADIAVMRYTLEPVELGGVEIPADEPVQLVYHAGNHDRRHFEAPEELRPERGGQSHLGFGQGAHFCLGAALARAEGQIAFATLLRRFPDLALVTPGDPPMWQPGFARALASLPVRLR